MMGGVITPFWAGLMLPLLAFSLLWKGIALWKATKNNDKVWFIILLILNTVGIADILYILLKKDTQKIKK